MPILYPVTDRTRLRVRYELEAATKWIEHLTSFEACQRAYVTARDLSGLGASRFGTGEVLDEAGQVIAHISYNGRLWPPLPWSPDMRPLAEAPEI